MRFVPSNCLRPGMQVAKTLYGRNSEILLVVGATLTKKNIESICRLKFPGIYINDDLSRDIEIISTISDELRIETMNGIKRVFTNAKDPGSKREKIKEISRQIESIVDELLANRNLMVNMIDLKCFDNYTYLHSVNVAVLSIVLGIAMGLDRNTLLRLGMGAILHDIGKVFINLNIINKPGALTPEEFEEVKKHSMLGYDYARAKFKLPATSYLGIRDHHEKYNGSGYPNGKSGKDISLFGRVIALADIYDALSSERPYRSALSPSEAMEYIMGNLETVFDPKLATIFLRKVAPYPVGTTVELSNGCTAIVMENYEACCLRPKVRVYKVDGREVEPFELDLSTDFSALNVVIKGSAKE
jgi:HD-GYP domain-containing protein (c-di-GMP phosphodiesterase class II)